MTRLNKRTSIFYGGWVTTLGHIGQNENIHYDVLVGVADYLSLNILNTVGLTPLRYMKIIISPDGKVLTMYRDEVHTKLLSLGDITIERASNVEFDPVHKRWEVKDIKYDKVLATSIYRSLALQDEVKIIENNLVRYL